MAVPVWNLVELPDTVSNFAGAMLEPAAVALHAVRRLGDINGKQVCIVGTGAIRLLAGQWAKEQGAANVTIMGRSRIKKALVEENGLGFSMDDAGEFDCVIEAVGSAEAICRAVGMTAPGGKLVLLGNPDGKITLPQENYWRILRKQLVITGSWNSSYQGAQDDWKEAIRKLREEKIPVERLVTHQFRGEELVDALRIFTDKKEAYCKVMVSFAKNNNEY